MRKFIIFTPFIFFLCMVVALALIFTTFTGRLEENEKMYKEEVGQTYVLGGDTLTIVDYSTIKETFTLSNGKEVSYLLIKAKK